MFEGLLALEIYHDFVFNMYIRGLREKNIFKLSSVSTPKSIGCTDNILHLGKRGKKTLNSSKKNSYTKTKASLLVLDFVYPIINITSLRWKKLDHIIERQNKI